MCCFSMSAGAKRIVVVEYFQVVVRFTKKAISYCIDGTIRYATLIAEATSGILKRVK